MKEIVFPYRDVWCTEECQKTWFLLNFRFQIMPPPTVLEAHVFKVRLDVKFWFSKIWPTFEVCVCELCPPLEPKADWRSGLWMEPAARDNHVKTWKNLAEAAAIDGAVFLSRRRRSTLPDADAVFSNDQCCLVCLGSGSLDGFWKLDKFCMVSMWIAFKTKWQLFIITVMKPKAKEVEDGYARRFCRL